MDRGRVERPTPVRQQLGELLVPAVARRVRVAQHRSGDGDRLQLGLARLGGDGGEGGQRVGRQPDPVRPGEEAGDGLDRHHLGAAFGQELAKGVVEAQVGGVRGTLGRAGCPPCTGGAVNRSTASAR